MRGVPGGGSHRTSESLTSEKGLERRAKGGRVLHPPTVVVLMSYLQGVIETSYPSLRFRDIEDIDSPEPDDLQPAA